MERRQFICFLGVSGGAIAAGLSFAPRAALALGEDEAAALVQSTVDEVLALVRGDGSTAAKAEGLRQIMERRAAMPQIARFAAGAAWRSMSADQQARYSAAFSHLVATVYARRFQEYSGETVTLGRAADAGKKGVLVQSSVSQTSAPPIKVDWLVSDRAGKPLIADIVIEGVSLATTQREEVNGMLDARGGDVEKLIEALKAA